MPDYAIEVLSFIVSVGILIFVHELGHFLFAKLFRVGVTVFSLGFGAKLLSWKFGDTEYRISAFPLGGYVKMIGESVDDELPAEDADRSFMAKSPLQRIFIVAAGPAFNMLFAYLIFVVICLGGLNFLTTKIGKVLDHQPAARAGILPGDRITAINGKPITKWEELNDMVGNSGGKSLDIKVQRGETTFSVRVTPSTMNTTNELGESVNSPKIGVVPSGQIDTERFGLAGAFVKGAELSWDISKKTVIVFYKIIRGDISSKVIGSVISIGKKGGEFAKLGIKPFFIFVAALSITLGILNLLPIPILDGGHIVFTIWEMIFRKPVGIRTREIAQQVGLVLLLGLMALAMYNDFNKYLLNYFVR